MDGWKADDAGDIVLFPLAGWQSAMSPEVAIALRPDFFRSPAEMRTARPSGGETAWGPPPKSSTPRS